MARLSSTSSSSSIRSTDLVPDAPVLTSGRWLVDMVSSQHPVVRFMLKEVVWLKHPRHPMMERHGALLDRMMIHDIDNAWLRSQLDPSMVEGRRRLETPMTTTYLEYCAHGQSFHYLVPKSCRRLPCRTYDIKQSAVQDMLVDAGFRFPPLSLMQERAEQQADEERDMLDRLNAAVHVWVLLHERVCHRCYGLECSCGVSPLRDESDMPLFPFYDTEWGEPAREVTVALRLLRSTADAASSGAPHRPRPRKRRRRHAS